MRLPALYPLLLSAWLVGCSSGSASTDEEGVNERQLAGSESGNPPVSDTDDPMPSPCTEARSERACTRIEGCVWNVCPPNADCQAHAWCAPAEPPASPARTCAGAGNQLECLRLIDCQWQLCPPNADCQAPAWCALRTEPAPTCGSGSEYDLRRKGSEVVVPPSYRACGADAECTLVFTGCDSCCQQDAIAKALEHTFAENFREACADYMGAICDCSVVPAEAHCVAGICTLVRTAK